MHELERAAQDDPFLMDALEGYEASGNNIQADINELKHRLDERIASKKQRKLLLWRVMPIAACLLLMIGVGWWFVINKPEKPELTHVALNTVPKAGVQAPVKLAESASKPKHKSANALSPLPNPLITSLVVSNPVHRVDSVRYMIDTVAYKVAAYKVKENRTVDDLLKKMPVIKVDSNGLIAKNGNQFFGARLNGKEFAGGYVQQAIKNLPAGIIEKIQIVDDYGDQASKHQDVKLNPGAPLLSETVVHGQIKQKSDQIKPTPFRINGAEVRDYPVGNVEELLQGKVANLNIQNNTGAPGLRGSVNIRGLSNDTSHGDPVIRGYVKRNGQSYIINGKEVQDNPVGNVEKLTQGSGSGLLIKNATGAYDKNAALYSVSGKIQSQDGLPLKDIWIRSGRKLLGATDETGKFKVDVPANSILDISSENYKSNSVKIDRPSNLYVVLAQKPKQPASGQTTSRAHIAVPCQENIEFKTKFFNNVAVANRYVFEHAGGYVSTVKDNAFLNALRFIGKYVPDSILPNAKAIGYDNLKAFAEYKKHWLAWYQTHKCELNY